MPLTRLDVQHFRLFNALSLSPHAGINLFVGQNAQGKTSLLEAIHYLSVGRSFRTSRDQECQSFERTDAEVTGITGILKQNEQDDKIRLALHKGKKKVWINDHHLSVLTDLWGTLTTVVFQPADLMILRGSPSQRRELLDRLAGQLNRQHLRHTQAYHKALQSRNILLKQRTPDTALFTVYEAQMAQYGSQIMATRAALIEEMSHHVEHCLWALCDEKINVRTHYRPSISPALKPENSIEFLTQFWKKSRDKDRDRGMTMDGPHRDDLMIDLRGKEAKTFASQGEVRSCVLALRLAELELLDHARPGVPVLLLDDILGELDANRSIRFLELVREKQVQTFITATDAQIIEQALQIDQRFDVHAGAVTDRV